MFEVKYGPEVIDCSDNWDDAVIKAEDVITRSNVTNVYILDTSTNTRFDQDDWSGDGIGWNDHLN